MHCIFIRGAISVVVVPDQQNALLRRHGQANFGKIRIPARANRIEIGHRRDRTLPAALGLILPIVGFGPKYIEVMFEFLSRSIALPLHGLTPFVRQADQGVDSVLDPLDERIEAIDIARAAGPPGLGIAMVEHAGRLSSAIDHRHQLAAFGRAQKIRDGPDFCLVGIHSVHRRVGIKRLTGERASP